MSGTQDLIERIVADSRPVQRLAPPLVRAAAWIGFALALLGVAFVVYPFPQGVAARFENLHFCFCFGGSVATGLLAAVAAFHVSLPDRSKWWVLLPMPAAAVWAGTLGLVCANYWQPTNGGSTDLGQTAYHLGIFAYCVFPLSAGILLMLQRAVMLDTVLARFTAAISVGALSASTLAVLGTFNSSWLLLAWNFGPVAVMLAVYWVIGPRWFGRLPRLFSSSATA